VLDNLRAALEWASAPEAAADRDRVQLGLRILIGGGRYWALKGLYSEEQDWVRRFAEVAEGDSAEHAELLGMVAQFHLSTGRAHEARTVLDRCIAMGRAVDSNRALAVAYDLLFGLEVGEGNPEAATRAAKLAQVHAVAGKELDIEADLLVGQVMVAIESGDFETAIEQVAARHRLLAGRLSPIDLLEHQHQMAWVLRRAGRPQEALAWARQAVRSAMIVGFPYGNGLPYLAEDYAGILADLGDAAGAVHLLGAADARRERNGNLRPPDTEVDMEVSIRHAREALSEEEWRLHHERGHALPLEDALTTAEQSPPSAVSD
jgi:tetratricopeptide (TPR) repeat protein